MRMEILQAKMMKRMQGVSASVSDIGYTFFYIAYCQAHVMC